MFNNQPNYTCAMREHGVRVANNGVPKALESFAKAEGKWNKLNENLKQ
jgi:hypothetical protein